MLMIPDNAQNRELSTPNVRDVEVAELCSRALEVITMTSEVTLDLKDSIARISERDLIQFRFQQRPLASVLGRDSAGARVGSGRCRKALVERPGERMVAWDR